MSDSRYLPDAVFEPAPAGSRVRLATVLTLAVVVIAMAATTAAMVHERRPPPWPAFLAAPVVVLALAVSWFGARVRRYRLTADGLRVERAFQTVRFTLAGLESAVSDRGALQGARKISGNDGLGAVAGRFRSKRLGRFRAYLTDAEHAVVLRWPDRCLVISPQQHSLFIESVRKRAGLSR